MRSFDVAIMGDGLAASCLALQLKRRAADTRVVIVACGGASEPNGLPHEWVGGVTRDYLARLCDVSAPFRLLPAPLGSIAGPASAAGDLYAVDGARLLSELRFEVEQRISIIRVNSLERMELSGDEAPHRIVGLAKERIHLDARWLVDATSDGSALGQWIDRARSLSTVRTRFSYFQPRQSFAIPSQRFPACGTERWAFIGEANGLDKEAAAITPLFVPANCIVTELVRLDRARSPMREAAVHWNDWYIELVRDALSSAELRIQVGGDPLIAAVHQLWESAHARLRYEFQYRELLFKNPSNRRIHTRLLELAPTLVRQSQTHERMRLLIRQWIERTTQRLQRRAPARLTLPSIENLSQGGAQGTLDDRLRSYGAGLLLCDELAQGIFRVALADVMPETLARFGSPFRANVRGLGLEPGLWDRDRTLSASGSRDAHPIFGEVLDLLACPSVSAYS